MPTLEAILNLLQQADVLGNTLGRWLTALALALGMGVALWSIRRLLIWRAEAALKAHPSDWLGAVVDLLKRTKGWLLLILSLYAGSVLLAVPDRAARIAASVAVMALLIQAALWGDALVKFFFLYRLRHRAETDASTATTLAALGFLARLAIWTLVVLLALANLGVDITAMVAGLGIGGVAVALAAQNVLGDLFASASIVLDKPFVLGDFIIAGQDMGTIEHIGLKTTRVRSLSGEQLVFPNHDLLTSRIHNYKRMSERRVLFSLGVTYQTPAEKLAAIPAMLRAAIEAQSSTRFDRAHFQQFGDSALVFEIVYYVLSPDYNLYMDIQQAINLAVFRRFAQEQIEFAYPTQTVYLAGSSEQDRQ